MPDQLVTLSVAANGDGVVKLASAIIAKLGSIPEGVIGAEYEQRYFGLEDPVSADGEYRLLTLESPGAMELFWHSGSHLMAQAVLRLYPKAKLAIGPAIRDGFYYDFDFGETFSSDDLEKVEAEMHKIVAENYPITRKAISPEEGVKLFTGSNQGFKLELIEGISEQLSLYTQGDFTDLCRGPHIPSTGYLKHFKLLSVTGAYWRGDERNPMLQRIYGTAFPTKAQLDEYLNRIEEAKKRDHRILGKQLGLFSFHSEATGMPFWMDKGALLFRTIAQYLMNHLRKRGYTEVRTPLILERSLWERSGHWDHYLKNMYFTSIEEKDYAVKPMNCPGAVLMYNDTQRSYRDMPMRWAELGIVHRYEKSGTLHGLFRVRAFTQDDAHIFCTEEQLVDEVEHLINLLFEIYGHFGMYDVKVELSTRPKDRIGSDQAWDLSEAGLKTALKRQGISYIINEGEGAFYGPKIDFHVTDSLGRSWQCGTIQVDYNFPERFGLEYIGADNQPHRPVMLHRAILGSMERFIGILIEHYAGDFPLWLAPEQGVILPITEKQNGAAEQLYDRLAQAGFRMRIDDRNEKVGKKIRDAELLKVPYMLVIGGREAEAGTVSVRSRGKGDLGVMPVDELVRQLNEEIMLRTTPLEEARSSS